MKSFLENSVSDLRAQGASQVVIFAHYYITGSKLSKASYTQVLPDEFQFTRDMFPHGVDLGVFGHIHVHQQVMENPPVLYTGSVEHMDWGEWEDDKGFISLSISGEEKGGGLSGCIGSSLDEGHRGKISWSFVKLPTRKIRRIRVSINADDDNPTERILAAIPQDVSGSMLRVDIRTRDAVRKRIDETRLARRLQDAFDYELMYSETDSGTVGVTGFTADPFELVREFIELNYKKDPRYGELQKCAREILDEVLK
jgi:exonuclease SbcD